MKVNYFETELSPIDFLAPDSLTGVTEFVKGLLTGDQVHDDKLSYWQLVFLQSKANGCFYHGEDLPQINWQWPKNTWFQEQLSHRLKDLEFAGTPSKELTVPAMSVSLGSRANLQRGSGKRTERHDNSFKTADEEMAIAATGEIGNLASHLVTKNGELKP